MSDARRVGYVEAAAFIGIPVGTLRSMVSRRLVPHIRLGKRHVLFALDGRGGLAEWLAGHAVAPRETEGLTSTLRLVGGDR